MNSKNSLIARKKDEKKVFMSDDKEFLVYWFCNVKINFWKL